MVCNFIKWLSVSTYIIGFFFIYQYITYYIFLISSHSCILEINHAKFYLFTFYLGASLLGFYKRLVYNHLSSSLSQILIFKFILALYISLGLSTFSTTWNKLSNWSINHSLRRDIIQLELPDSFFLCWIFTQFSTSSRFIRQVKCATSIESIFVIYISLGSV